MHLHVLWMSFMLGFICIGFAELWGKGSKRKIQNEKFEWKYTSPAGFEPATLGTETGALGRWATPTVVGLFFKSPTPLWHVNKINTFFRTVNHIGKQLSISISKPMSLSCILQHLHHADECHVLVLFGAPEPKGKMHYCINHASSVRRR